MSVIKNIKTSKQGGLDLRDILFLLCVILAVYGSYVQFGLGVACMVGGGSGMYLIYASTPGEPEQPEEELVIDPQKGVIRKTA